VRPKIAADVAITQRIAISGSFEPMSTDSGHVNLVGPQTIREIEQTRSAFIAAIHGSHAVTIDCTSVTDVDMTFVQLLISTRKTAISARKTLSFSSPPPNSLLDALTRAGLLGSPDEAPLADDAFWRGRETANV
jgi:ABC-type transporter Mla MlaB component